MKNCSDVFFIPVENDTSRSERCRRLQVLLHQAGFHSLTPAGGTVGIKMHFGEQGNTGYVPPWLVRVISDGIAGNETKRVCVDTNTLYRGRRTNSADHAHLAREHGFTDEATGATLVIPDDREKDAAVTLPVAGRLLSEVHTFRFFSDLDVLVGLAHFKGHLMTGFGGALKNIGMGCATREGKLEQHCGAAPFVIARKCIGCGDCAEVCPVDAISLSEEKAFVDSSRCIGCASCIAACGSAAMELDWGKGAATIIDKMVEYTAAILSSAQKTFFINIAQHITAECDCIAGDDPKIIPDIGYLASDDPVALDQASYDLSCSAAGGYDPYRKAHPRRDPLRQLDYAELMGVGTRTFNLIKVAV